MSSKRGKKGKVFSMLKKIVCLVMVLFVCLSITSVSFGAEPPKTITVTLVDQKVNLSSNWSIYYTRVLWKRANGTEYSQLVSFSLKSSTFSIPADAWAVKIDHASNVTIFTELPAIYNSCWIIVKNKPAEVWTNLSHSSTHTPGLGHQIYQVSTWGNHRWICSYETDTNCTICHPKPSNAIDAGKNFETGVNNTKYIYFKVDTNELGIIGAFSLDGISDGVYKVYTPGIYTANINNGFLVIVSKDKAQAEWDARLKTAKDNGWACAHIDKGPLK